MNVEDALHRALIMEKHPRPGYPNRGNMQPPFQESGLSHKQVRAVETLLGKSISTGVSLTFNQWEFSRTPNGYYCTRLTWDTPQRFATFEEMQNFLTEYHAGEGKP